MQTPTDQYLWCIHHFFLVSLCTLFLVVFTGYGFGWNFYFNLYILVVLVDGKLNCSLFNCLCFGVYLFIFIWLEVIICKRWRRRKNMMWNAFNLVTDFSLLPSIPSHQVGSHQQNSGKLLPEVFRKKRKEKKKGNSIKQKVNWKL